MIFVIFVVRHYGIFVPLPMQLLRTIFFLSFGDVKIVNLKRTHTAIKFLWQQQEAPKECYESTTN